MLYIIFLTFITKTYTGKYYIKASLTLYKLNMQL
jgi:hypothetical protein